MPIAELTSTMHDTNKSVPLQILNKGPEFFRQQALRNQHRQPTGKTAAERLAETRSQYLKRDSPSPPPLVEILNGNTNNHAQDNRLAGDGTGDRCRVGKISCQEDNDTLSQERIGKVDKSIAKKDDDVTSREKICDLYEKRESGRGRERKRDSRRGKRRAKAAERNMNSNSVKSCTDEKASQDSPEYAQVFKDTKHSPESVIRMANSAGQEAEPLVSDSSSSQQKTSRTSVREIVSKISARSCDSPCDLPGDIKAPRRLSGGGGRQRSSRTTPLVSSESSETSPTFPRKAFSSHATRASRSRGRERTKPLVPTKPQNMESCKKTPQGSRVQNILNAFHQQTSNVHSTKDEMMQRFSKASSVRSRGKSCPPTNRAKPSLADLLQRDAEGARPRSKDLNDLDQLISAESEDLDFVDVKARIKSFQFGSVHDPLERSSSEKLSHSTSHESSSIKQSGLFGGKRNKKERLNQTSLKLAPSSQSPQSSKTSSDSSSPPSAKQTPVSHAEDVIVDAPDLYAIQETPDLYALPNKLRGPRGPPQGSQVDVSHSHSSNASDKERLYLLPQDVSLENTTMSEKSSVLSKEVFNTESEDTGFGEQLENLNNQGEPPRSSKPLIPKKPDFSVVDKLSRYSYHVYEAVTDLPEEEFPDIAPPDQKDDCLETPGHFSEPEESFEVVTKVSVQQREACRTRSMPLMARDVKKEKIEPVVRQGSVLSSITSHMRKLKGILLGDKEQSLPQKDAKENLYSGTKEVLGNKSATTSNLKSRTQRKLAAHLGLEGRDHASDVKTNSSPEQKGSNAAPESRDANEEKCNTSSRSGKISKPVHSKSFSLDEIKRTKLKTSLSADNGNMLKTKGIEDSPIDQSKRPYFPMPHEKQKRELSKKLEKFLQQSKAYDSAGDSPTKESSDFVGKLKKKVSFDDETVAVGTTDTHEKPSEKISGVCRKVSITPMTENYDVVEYNTDTKDDLVEEMIVIDSSNAIRLASPRPSPTSILSDTTKVAVKKKIPKIREETTEGLGDFRTDLCNNNEERQVRCCSEPAEPRESTFPLIKESQSEYPGDSVPKSHGIDTNYRPPCTDSEVTPNATSKLTSFRKASVSTDLDTSPTHDFHGTALNSHLDLIKHQSGTSSSGNAKVKGEYDTSSRSDDCGLGATKGKVKHLKPFNARPFRNKNFSSDEDVIPEEHSRKSFWHTKAQLDLSGAQHQHRARESKPNSPCGQLATREILPRLTKQSSDQESSAAEGEGVNGARCGMRRSKSEPNHATCVDELDSFFNRMGLDDSILEVASKPHIYDEEEVFHDMHVWRTRGLHGGSESDDSNTSYARSETSNVSEDGVMNLRKFTKQLPDQSMSIVTKNARVIKWMYQCRKSLEQAPS